MQSFFQNCIITGSTDNEFSLATRFLDQYHGIFDNCYIRKSDSLNLPQFQKIHWAERNDSVFKSIRYDLDKNTYFDFRLDSISPARGIGNKIDPIIVAKYHLDFDLNGNVRPADKSDAGAYQWQPTK